MHPDVVALSFPVTSSLDSYSDKKLWCAAFHSLFTYTGSSASCSHSWPLKGFLSLSWQFSLQLFLTDVLHPQSVIRCSHNSLQWLHSPLSGIGRELWLVQMLDDSFSRPYLVGLQHLFFPLLCAAGTLLLGCSSQLHLSCVTEQSGSTLACAFEWSLWSEEYHWKSQH